jgi:predicted transcriptional regulator
MQPGVFGMKLSWFTVLSLLVFVTPAWAGPAPGRATFHYELGSTAEGQIQGVCDGHGFEYHPGRAGRLDATFASGTLRFYKAWHNYTLLLPPGGSQVYHRNGLHQDHRDFSLEGGPLAVSWTALGRSAVLDNAGYHAPGAPLQVQTAAERATWALPVQGHKVDDRFEVVRDKLEFDIVVFPGWGRFVDLDARASMQIRGDAALHLRDGHVKAHGFEFQLPPGLVVEQTDLHGAAFVREIHHYALLMLEGFHAAPSPGDGRLFCHSATFQVDGRYTAFQATGAVAVGDVRAEFEKRELTLEGQFLITEAPRSDNPAGTPVAPVVGQGEGEFHAVGFDFEPAPGLPASWATAEAAVGAALAAGAAIGLWKLLSGLFTRLREDRLLDLDARRRVHAAVLARPGISLKEIAVQERMNFFTALYHVRVLQRHGQLRAVKVGRAYRLSSTPSNAAMIQREVRLAEDEKVRSAVELVGSSAPAKAVVRALQDRWGLSRTGGWKVIERALATGLLARERNGKEVFLRPAP